MIKSDTPLVDDAATDMRLHDRGVPIEQAREIERKLKRELAEREGERMK